MAEDQFNHPEEDEIHHEGAAEEAPADRFRRLAASEEEPDLNDLTLDDLTMSDAVSASLESTLSMAGAPQT